MSAVRLLQAADFAATKHADQRRKGGQGNIPYINHPLTVARLLAEVGGVADEDVLVAALLHDTVEDTATSPEELERGFGPTVRRLVAEVSDDKNLPKAERKRLQIEHAGKLSAGAVLIKIADKIANVHDLSRTPPPDWPLERVREYLTWAEAVVRACPRLNQALDDRFQAELQDARRRVG